MKKVVMVRAVVAVMLLKWGFSAPPQVPAGDKVHPTGFGVTNLGKGMLSETSIIKENGEWKWYGNQRDPKP
jgi:hypothetical protein